MASKDIIFLQRTFPSANMVLLRGARPILIDSGFGSDLPETERLLTDYGSPPASIDLIANTHYHCDHVGGNHGFQSRYGTRIAAHRWEGTLINHRDREACSAVWLNQPIEPYQVNVLLNGGEEFDTGSVRVQVIPASGHTLGHLAYYVPEAKTLICGDAVHGDDVAWVNTFREGAGAILRLIETLEKLLRMDIQRVYSGHGAAILKPQTAFTSALQRYEKWLDEPEKVGWHACKRILTYALMLDDGLTEGDLRRYLLSSPWYLDYCRFTFGAEPQDFIAPMTDELLRSGAAEWQKGKLVARASYNSPSKSWLQQASLWPHQWPAVTR